MKDKGSALPQTDRCCIEFLSRVNHEMRTPLASIINMTEIALQTRLDLEQRDYMQTVLGSAKQMLLLLNEFMTYTRIEESNLELKQVSFELDRLVETTCTTLQMQCRNKMNELHWNVDSSVFSTRTGDPGRLRQLIASIVTFASRIVEHGKIVLSLNGSSDRDVHRLEIAAVGCCIKEDTLKELREITQGNHQHLESRKDALGLFVSSVIVRQMGGELTITPSADGVVFSAELKIKKAEKEHETRNIPKEAGNKSLQILVVEDDPVSAKVLRIFFEKLSHKVVWAESGNEMYSHLNQSDFDFLLLDLELPDARGEEMLRRLRAGELGERNKSVPAIAMTAQSEEDVEQEQWEGVFYKPVNLVRLSDIVKQYSSKQMQSADKTPVSSEKSEVAENIKIYLSKLESARQEGDSQVLAELAESLKGFGMYIGASRLAQVAQKLLFCKTQGPELDEICATIKQELGRAGELLT